MTSTKILINLLSYVGGLNNILQTRKLHICTRLDNVISIMVSLPGFCNKQHIKVNNFLMDLVSV